MVLDFSADDDGTTRFGCFELTILLKLKVCTIEKMVSDNNGGFTPTISSKNKPEGGPWQRQAINPLVPEIKRPTLEGHSCGGALAKQCKTKIGLFGLRLMQVRPEVAAGIARKIRLRRQQRISTTARTMAMAIGNYTVLPHRRPGRRA